MFFVKSPMDSRSFGQSAPGGLLDALLRNDICGACSDDCCDPERKDLLMDIGTEEVMAALGSMGKPALSIGQIEPTPGLVDEYFNDSTGEGITEKSMRESPGTKATAGDI